MKSVFITLVFLLSLSVFANSKPAWVSYAQVDLTQVTSSAELATLLSSITQEMIYDGERASCTFNSKITQVNVEGTISQIPLLVVGPLVNEDL